jgi:hypothetical protein
VQGANLSTRPIFQLDTFTLETVSHEWHRLKPSSSSFPQGAVQSIFHHSKSGLLLTVYGIIDMVACANSKFSPRAGGSPFLETYSIEEVNTEAGTVSFKPLILYHANIHYATYWQTHCQAQAELRRGQGTPCHCEKGNVTAGSAALNGTGRGFQWQFLPETLAAVDGNESVLLVSACLLRLGLMLLWK